MSEAVFERRDPGAIRSAALSIAVHLLLVLVLFFGIRWRTSQPEPIMAELWSALPAIEAPRPPPPVAAPKPEPRPVPKAEPEPRPEPKPDIALEEERKRKEEAEKKRREEEAQRRKREEELKARAEAERKEKELAEQRRREEQAAEQRRIQEQLAKALGPAPKAAAPTVASGAAGDPAALATWQQQIVGKVRSNIVLPPDLAGNPEAQFDVTLLPTGEVLSVKLVRSSGNRVLDDAWERAILKSSPLPKPAQPELFRRDLRLVFRPRTE